MATFDHASDLVHYIPYPAVRRPAVGTSSRAAVFVADGEKLHPTSSNKQGIEEDGGLFKNTLFASGESFRLRNPWAAVGALMLQLLVLAMLILVPLFHTPPLPPKRETLTLLYAPPPAAGPSSTPRYQAPTSSPAYTSTKSSIPAPVPKTQETPSTPAGSAGGVIGGVPGGIVGGVPGGVLNGFLSSTRGVPLLVKAPAVPINRVRLAPRVVEANLIHDVPPTYPPEAGRQRIEGTVVLLAVIGKDGSVQDVRVESGLPILAQAAIDAVKQWRYRPYLLNGEPVEVDSRITINFTLTRG
jgi:periplasmic protein TonB